MYRDRKAVRGFQRLGEEETVGSYWLRGTEFVGGDEKALE